LVKKYILKIQTIPSIINVLRRRYAVLQCTSNKLPNGDIPKNDVIEKARRPLYNSSIKVFAIKLCCCDGLHIVPKPNEQHYEQRKW